MTGFVEIPCASRYEKRRARFLFSVRKEKARNEDEQLAATQSHGVLSQKRYVEITGNRVVEALGGTDNFTHAEKNDFVISLRSFEGGIEIATESGSISPAYTVLKPSAHLNPKYYRHLLKSSVFISYLQTTVTGIREGKSVKFENLANIILPVPDPEEQKHIADFLDRETARIDQLIEKKTKLLSILEESVETKITSILTSGLKEGLQHQENNSCPSSEYPNHWKLLKLRHAGSCANGINISGDAFGSGTPFISYGDVYKNAQIPDTILGLVECSAEDKKRYSIKRGDVLFTRTSENIEDIGTASTCMTDVPDGVYAGFLIRFRPNPNVLLPEYSKFLFRNSTVRSFFSKEVMLVTRASLSQNLLKNLPLALPPLNEQIGLSKIMLDIEASHVELISKIEATILSLREYKSSIITAAVTGQIDVKSFDKSGAVDRHLDQLQDEGRA